ncbi:MAG: hypothetical protein PWP08_491 [Methanofollis sp.]|nr:hypothetical protein [Methanofollis sp.]
MQKRTLSIFMGIFILLLCLNPTEARIIVEPGPAELPTDMINVDDEYFVPLWEVPPMRLITTYVLIYCPLIAFPVEMIYSSGLWAYLIYRTASRKVPESENRKKIHACIKDCPGISASQIAGAIGISRGAVAYHLSRLRAEQRIKKSYTRGYVGYLTPDRGLSPNEEHTLLHMQNATEKKILFLLLNTPDLSQSELAAEIGISGPAISWHMMRLNSDGIIQSFIAGRETHYRLMPGIPLILIDWTGNGRDTRDYEGATA